MGQFERLIRMACASEYQYIEHSSDNRMSCGAIVDGCLRRCYSTPERLNELRRNLEDPQQYLPSCRAFRRQTAKLFAEGRLSGGIPDHTYMHVSGAFNDAQFELAQLGHSLYELWSIAAQDASIKNPECFGTVTSMDNWRERQAELKAERDRLFEQINQTFEPGDTIVGPPRADGSVRVFVRLAPEVSLYPLSNLGERLIHHLLSKDADRWAKPLPEEPLKARKRKMQPRQEVAVS